MDLVNTNRLSKGELSTIMLLAAAIGAGVVHVGSQERGDNAAATHGCEAELKEILSNRSSVEQWTCVEGTTEYRVDLNNNTVSTITSIPD